MGPSEVKIEDLDAQGWRSQFKLALNEDGKFSQLLGSIDTLEIVEGSPIVAVQRKALEGLFNILRDDLIIARYDKYEFVDFSRLLNGAAPIAEALMNQGERPDGELISGLYSDIASKSLAAVSCWADCKGEMTGNFVDQGILALSNFCAMLSELRSDCSSIKEPITKLISKVLEYYCTPDLSEMTRNIADMLKRTFTLATYFADPSLDCSLSKAVQDLQRGGNSSQREARNRNRLLIPALEAFAVCQRPIQHCELWREILNDRPFENHYRTDRWQIALYGLAASGAEIERQQLRKAMKLMVEDRGDILVDLLCLPNMEQQVIDQLPKKIEHRRLLKTSLEEFADQCGDEVLPAIERVIDALK